MNDNDASLSENLASLRKIQQQTQAEYDTQAENFWNSLSEEQRLQVFYCVSKRIYDGEIKDKGSYRYVLYDVFGFGPESYGVGIMAGYMNIHNSIFQAQDKE